MESFLLIAGPCLLESPALAEEVARELVGIREEHGNLRVVFKASVDKANRSSVHSPRGPGFREGLRVLGEIREKFQLEVTTDFHEPNQAEAVAEVCDVVQIPAFLCRQTDMLAAAARTGRTVSVKKGQFLAPWDMVYVVEKLRAFGARDIILMERGTCFGYGNLVVDMRSFPIMAASGCPVVYDLTHSLQLPSTGKSTTGGDRKFADTLAMAAISAGIDGLFLETHPTPERALCDADTQLPLHSLAHRLKRYLALREFVVTLQSAP